MRSWGVVLAGIGGIAAAATVATILVRKGSISKRLVVKMTSLPSSVAVGGKRYIPKRPANGAPLGQLTVLPSDYPTVNRDDSVVDVMHGYAIPDPYRWLEDPDAKETAAFVDVQNELTQKVLSQCKDRTKMKDLVESLFDYERYGLPFRKGSRWYFFHNTGLQAQSVLYTQSSLEDERKVLMDPNKLSDDGTTALMGQAFSDCGSYMAYSISKGGSDWRTIKIMSIDQTTGDHTAFDDELNHVKFSSMAWTHDNKGFFYNRYEPPNTTDAGTETNKNLNQELCYHVLGTDQAEDVNVLSIPDNPEWMIGAEVSKDGRFLILTISSGCEPVNRLWFVDLDTIPRKQRSRTAITTNDENAKEGVGALDFKTFDFKTGSSPLPIVKLVDNFSAGFDYIGSTTTEDGRTLWTLQTNLSAPRYRLVRCDPFSGTPAEEWETVVEEHPKDLLQWASLLKGEFMVLCYLRNVKSQLQLRSFTSGALLKELTMPGVGSVSGFSGSHKYTDFFFSYVSFNDPGAQYRLYSSVKDPEASLFRRTSTKFDPETLETKQVFVKSKDGTQIPMFIMHKKGLKLDGNNPCLLYGYGGFNISLEPSFSAARVSWCLAYDAILAVANIRGGGEFGREWRDAGSLGKKQNCFDDFQACTEWLHSSEYTSPARTAIQGGSNGGLLVAACANQRPDLYSAVLAQVGVHDMLRFHRFTIGHAWQTDYGVVDKEEDFNWLIKYSPLHNVAPIEGGSQQYPAMMVTTGDHDDRVVPLHSLKLVATLQHALASAPDAPQRNPILARVEVKAGHGAGKPTQKIIEEVSDMFAFAAGVMGVEWKHSN